MGIVPEESNGYIVPVSDYIKKIETVTSFLLPVPPIKWNGYFVLVTYKKFFVEMVIPFFLLLSLEKVTVLRFFPALIWL
jgi:hypothetical protein